MTNEPVIPTLRVLRLLVVLDNYPEPYKVKVNLAFEKNHNLPMCENLASSLSSDQAILLTTGESDERGQWLEDKPHMRILNSYLEDFFETGMSL